MGLIDLFKKKNTKAYQEEVDMQHLTKDGDLPWGWEYHNKELCDRTRKEFKFFLDNWIASRGMEPRKERDALLSFVTWLYDSKKLFFSKNECFAKWYTICIAKDEYIANRQAELDELNKKFNTFQHEWEIRQSILPNLAKNVKEKLLQCDGIYQPEFVKMFDESVQDDVKHMLYNMDKEGTLQRTKQGRSYILHLIKR